jgi:hypothetical protein
MYEKLLSNDETLSPDGIPALELADVVVVDALLVLLQAAIVPASASTATSAPTRRMRVTLRTMSISPHPLPAASFLTTSRAKGCSADGKET